MKHEPFNESTEMYLKTVSELSSGEEAVPISALARSLGVSAVSATEMVHRLQDQGLVEHIPYRGIRLTEEGQQQAFVIIRSHQLWEYFLAEHLKLPWEQVHEYACRLEHATDEAVIDALDEYLGEPARCPHGNPIPHIRGEDPAEEGCPLSDLKTGARGTILAIHPESTELLAYLAQQQLKPGQPIVINEIAPFDGPFMVQVGEAVQALGREVASHIFVRVDAA